MTKTEIDLYVELQDVFVPFKGEWQAGDKGYHKEWGIGIVIEGNEITKSHIHVFFPKEKIEHLFTTNEQDVYFSWLPLPIDPVNPERGLWEMIDWYKVAATVYDFGSIGILSRDKSKLICYGNVTEALLRAIKAQKEERNVQEINSVLR